jgi:hypothetical protein
VHKVSLLLALAKQLHQKANQSQNNKRNAEATLGIFSVGVTLLLFSTQVSEKIGLRFLRNIKNSHLERSWS